MARMHTVLGGYKNAQDQLTKYVNVDVEEDT